MQPPNRIISIGTAVPPLCVNQQEAFDAFSTFRRLSDKEKILYERFLSDSSIETRYVATDQLENIFTEDHDGAHARFARYAVVLAVQALAQACAQVKIRPEMLDGLIVTTCTGYLCPGLSSYIMEKLSFKEGAVAMDLVGHGCAAALPALRSADDMLKAQGLNHVAIVCVEICTAAIFFGDCTDLILSNSIFGDGAAACIVSADPSQTGMALERFEGLVWPQYREDLRFTQKDGRLCNQLSRRVPDVVAEAVEYLRSLVNSCEASDVSGLAKQHYAFHLGGKKILDAIQERLHLAEEQMAPSREVLRNFGNMSSGSILFVLKELMLRAAPGEEILLFSYGAGFSAFGALGRVVGCAHTKGVGHGGKIMRGREEILVDQ